MYAHGSPRSLLGPDWINKENELTLWKGSEETAEVVLKGARPRRRVGEQLLLDHALLGVLEARAQDHGVVGVAE